MKRVNIADLKNNLSRHLLHVRAGGNVVILDRDTPVAHIVPFGRVFNRPAGAAPRNAPKDDYWDADRVAGLERRGILTRPDSPASVAWARGLRPVKLPAGTPGAVDGLLRTRRESRR